MVEKKAPAKAPAKKTAVKETPHTVVQTSPLGRPGDVVDLDPKAEETTTFVRKGLVVKGEETVEVPSPPSTVAGTD